MDQNDTTWLVIESITFEHRDRVEVEPDKFRDNVDCTVVRLRWDPDTQNGKAFFALLPEDYATGWEQRIYLEAGKYTGIFFNVSEARLKALDHLTLYSVQGVKAKANKLTGIELGQPNDKGRPKAISD